MELAQEVYTKVSAICAAHNASHVDDGSGAHARRERHPGHARAVLGQWRPSIARSDQSRSTLSRPGRRLLGCRRHRSARLALSRQGLPLPWQGLALPRQGLALYCIKLITIADAPRVLVISIKTKIPQHQAPDGASSPRIQTLVNTLHVLSLFFILPPMAFRQWLNAVFPTRPPVDEAFRAWIRNRFGSARPG